MSLQVGPAPEDFGGWTDVLDLLRRCFAYMSGRIDPPSSLDRLDLQGLIEKAEAETVLLAQLDGELVGCAFVRREPDCLYIGKVAVAPAARGLGVARRLFLAAEEMARASGVDWLELQTRIELTENHETFRQLGFGKSGETAHAGHDRPTSITMRKAVRPTD